MDRGYEYRGLPFVQCYYHEEPHVFARGDVKGQKAQRHAFEMHPIYQVPVSGPARFKEKIVDIDRGAPAIRMWRLPVRRFFGSSRSSMTMTLSRISPLTGKLLQTPDGGRDLFEEFPFHEVRTDKRRNPEFWAEFRGYVNLRPVAVGP